MVAGGGGVSNCGSFGDSNVSGDSIKCDGDTGDRSMCDGSVNRIFYDGHDNDGNRQLWTMGVNMV